MKPFEQLTPCGQARRLRQLALVALEQYELPLEQVRILAQMFNTLFRIRAGDGSIYVLRVNRPNWRSRAEIQAEMTWLAALHSQTSLSVPRPLPNRAGSLVTTATALGVPESRHCTVFSWVPGQDLAQHLTEENLFKLGEFMAQLHKQAAGYTLPEGCQLETHRHVMLAKQRNRLLEDQAELLLSAAQHALFRQVYERVEAVLAQIYEEKGAPRILHADLHQGNVRFSRGQLHAIDFDDCLLGHPVQDVGISFFYLSGQPHYPQLCHAFQQGYTRHQPWPEDYPGQLESLMAGRGLLLVNFFLNSTNPQHQQLAPQFIAHQETQLGRYLSDYPA